MSQANNLNISNLEIVHFERSYLSVIEQHNALSCAADSAATASDMAGCYCDCMIADAIAQGTEFGRVEWSKVNDAINKRWPGMLESIKASAHREYRLTLQTARERMAALRKDGAE